MAKKSGGWTLKIKQREEKETDPGFCKVSEMKQYGQRRKDSQANRLMSSTKALGYD